MPSRGIDRRASPSKFKALKRTPRYLGSIAGARLSSPRKKTMERHQQVRPNLAQHTGENLPKVSGMSFDLIRHKLTWTAEMERAFLIALEKRNLQGLLQKKIYPEMWDEIALELRPVAKRLLTRAQLSQKYSRMKQAYKSYTSQRSGTGSGWDSSSNTVIVSEDSELGLQQASRGDVTSLPDLELSHTIFGFSTARGDRAMTPAAIMTPPNVVSQNDGEEFIDSNEPHTFDTHYDDIQPLDNDLNPFFESQVGEMGSSNNSVVGAAGHNIVLGGAGQNSALGAAGHNSVVGVAGPCTLDKGKMPMTHSNSNTNSRINVDEEIYMVGSRRKAIPSSSSSSSKKSRSSGLDSFASMTQSFQQVLSPQNTGLSRMLDAQERAVDSVFSIPAIKNDPDMMDAAISMLRSTRAAFTYSRLTNDEARVRFVRTWLK